MGSSYFFTSMPIAADFVWSVKFTKCFYIFLKAVENEHASSESGSYREISFKSHIILKIHVDLTFCSITYLFYRKVMF